MEQAKVEARARVLYVAERSKRVCRGCGAHAYAGLGETCEERKHPSIPFLKIGCGVAGRIEKLTHDEAVQGARSELQRELKEEPGAKRGTTEDIGYWKIVDAVFAKLGPELEKGITS